MRDDSCKKKHTRRNVLRVCSCDAAQLVRQMRALQDALICIHQAADPGIALWYGKARFVYALRQKRSDKVLCQATIFSVIRGGFKGFDAFGQDCHAGNTAIDIDGYAILLFKEPIASLQKPLKEEDATTSVKIPRRVRLARIAQQSL